jgi:hypothetical protein
MPQPHSKANRPASAAAAYWVRARLSVTLGLDDCGTGGRTLSVASEAALLGGNQFTERP